MFPRHPRSVFRIPPIASGSWSAKELQEERTEKHPTEDLLPCVLGDEARPRGCYKHRDLEGTIMNWGCRSVYWFVDHAL